MDDLERAKKAKEALKAYLEAMLDIPVGNQKRQAADILKEKEEFIQSLIEILSVSQKSFDSKFAIKQIRENLIKDTISDRLLYSKITEKLYSCTATDRANIEFNLKTVLNDVIENEESSVIAQQDISGDKTIELEKEQKRSLKNVVLKLYDHVLLAVFQVQQIQAAVDETKRNVFTVFNAKIDEVKKSKDDIFAAFDTKIDEVEKKVYRNAKDAQSSALLEISKKMSEESRNSQRGYVSTLGVFAAIMLAAFTSLAIAKDAMPLIANSLSNFVLVFCLVGSFIIILIQMLLNAVFSISDKYEQYKKTFLGHIISYLMILWFISGASYFFVFS